jgi:Mce-associated membrane protein
MNHHRRHHHLVAVLAIVLIAALAGCSGSDDTAEPAHDHDHGEHYSTPPGLPDRAEPIGVFTTTVTTMFSWQPATDTSPTDALRRTRATLTGQALASADSSATVRPSAQWGAWKQSLDVITARVDNASAVLISPDKASARGTVIQTVLGIDATVTSFRKFTVTADLVRVDGQWKVATYPRADT